MSNKYKLYTTISLIFMICIIIAGCSGADDATDEIKIGVTGPLTGSTANSGVALQEGMEMAIDEWNENGGIEIDGEKVPIKMYFEDNQGEPSEGVSAAEKLFNNEEVDVLIGDAFSSSVTMAIMDLASQYEKPIISGEPVSSAISEKVAEDPEKYKYFWKSNFSSEAYGDGAFSTVQYLIDEGSFEPSEKTVAFVVEDTDYGRSNVAEAQKLFEEAGWNQVAFETVDVGYTDFYPQLTKLNSLDPDVLVTCFTAVSSGVSLVKQFNETGMNSLHFAIYYPLRTEFVDQAKENAENLLWSPLSYSPSLIEAQREFAEAYEEKYDEKSSGDAAQGYDYMTNVLTAISEAKSVDADKIVDQLSKMSREGLIGTYEFDQENHTAKSGPEYLPVPSSQIQDGKDQIIWPENISTSEYITQSWIK